MFASTSSSTEKYLAFGQDKVKIADSSKQARGLKQSAVLLRLHESRLKLLKPPKIRHWMMNLRCKLCQCYTAMSGETVV